MARNNSEGSSPAAPISPREPQKSQDLQHEQLLELARKRMPFGKYQGRLLIDLPEPYIVWFAQKGFPEGKLGNMLQIIYEIKTNGLEYLFEPLR